MLDNNQWSNENEIDKATYDPNTILPKPEAIIETNFPIAHPETLAIDVLAQIDRRQTSESKTYSYVFICDRHNKLVGIITERDIVRLTAAQQDLTAITAAEIISDNPIALKKSALSNISTALDILKQHQIRHLPIVSDDNRLEGIINFSSICQAIHPATVLKFRRVAEVMNSQVLYTTPTTSVLELSRLMLENHQSYIAIVEPDSTQTSIPVGIVTERDLVKLQLQRINMTEVEAQTVMSQPLMCLNPDDPLMLVQQRMNQLRVRRLVVTGERGELKGIVHQFDLLRAIEPEELYSIMATLQQKTQKIQQDNENLRQEIAQRQAAELLLQREKELAQITLQSIGDAVVTTNLADEIEEFNPVAEKLTGWKATEVKGKVIFSVIQVIDENDRSLVPTPLSRVSSNTGVSSSLLRSVLIAKDGKEYPIRDSASPLRDRQEKIVGAVWIFHDVTESRRLNDRLSWQANHDTLTGLYNRRKFTDKLAEAMITAETESQHHILCYCDLDKFKTVNDTCGHGAGDALLRQITNLLSRRVRSVDTLARLGGDEFGLILYQCSLLEAVTVADILRKAVADFVFNWEQHTFSIGISIGITAIDSTTDDLNELIDTADAACYKAKAQGRNGIYVHGS